MFDGWQVGDGDLACCLDCEVPCLFDKCENAPSFHACMKWLEKGIEFARSNKCNMSEVKALENLQVLPHYKSYHKIKWIPTPPTRTWPN